MFRFSGPDSVTYGANPGPQLNGSIRVSGYPMKWIQPLGESVKVTKRQKSSKIIIGSRRNHRIAASRCVRFLTRCAFMTHFRAIQAIINQPGWDVFTLASLQRRNAYLGITAIRTGTDSWRWGYVQWRGNQSCGHELQIIPLREISLETHTYLSVHSCHLLTQKSYRRFNSHVHPLDGGDYESIRFC